MTVNSKKMKGLVVRAQDGELGAVEDLYFDDENWGVRYLTVVTGSWLAGKRVLISPLSVVAVDWQERRLEVSLLMKQVEDSPDIDTHKTVSRQHEATYLGYYGYPMYWGGPDVWATGPYVAEPLLPPIVTEPAPVEDSHLRSTAAVTGYSIEAADGEIGHVDGFLVDDGSWAIRYLEVATRNWWPGKKVLVSPAWIREVSWEMWNVSTILTRDAIRSAPEYLESRPVTRIFEEKLFLHYGLPPYWLGEGRPEASLALSR